MMVGVCGPLTSRSDSLSEEDHCRGDRSMGASARGNWRAWGQGPLAPGFYGAPVRPATHLGLPPNIPKSHEQFGEEQGTHWSCVFGSRIWTHEAPAGHGHSGVQRDMCGGGGGVGQRGQSLPLDGAQAWGQGEQEADP